MELKYDIEPDKGRSPMKENEFVRSCYEQKKKEQILSSGYPSTVAVDENKYYVNLETLKRMVSRSRSASGPRMSGNKSIYLYGQ